MFTSAFRSLVRTRWMSLSGLASFINHTTFTNPSSVLGQVSAATKVRAPGQVHAGEFNMSFNVISLSKCSW
ncbi:uncharacterized protein B0I36DRAFT_316756 [Microdochium trichocladiopsis]|uniref:Uncharacterized protein n=1 Tax=Microdochium trichocladiopsis TaxID=1682393 RepID=A0A9P8YAH5_9PEZI|nr:uncharacterized protein B0I36DRAFT_316756 [Microdochium trichocladiopsis]KAH7034687.1 hypothetical protein B0I36DRAFT_316756 [Microdochium trichocladiopsis]